MKKTILIDIDDTLIGSFELPLLNQFLGTTYTESDFADYIQEKLTEDNMDAFHDFLLTKDVYSDDLVHFNEDAIEVLRQLNDKHSVYLCSDYTFWERPWDSDHFFKSKYDFLKRNLAFIDPSQHVFLRNKKLLSADVMIDDRIDNFGQGIGQKLLFSAYHNKNINDCDLKDSGVERVSSWEEIAKILL